MQLTSPAVEPERRQRFGMWRRLPPKAKVGAILLGFFILIAIIGPLWPHTIRRYQNPSPNLSLNAPSAAHLLGTTQNGQDVLSQVLTGVRMTLELGIIVGVVATTIAVDRRDFRRLPGWHVGRRSLPPVQRLPGPARTAVADCAARVPAAKRPADNDFGPELPRLAMGRPDNPRPDPGFAQSRLCGGRARDRRAELAHHRFRDHAQRE